MAAARRRPGPAAGIALAVRGRGRPAVRRGRQRRPILPRRAAVVVPGGGPVRGPGGPARPEILPAAAVPRRPAAGAHRHRRPGRVFPAAGPGLAPGQAALHAAVPQPLLGRWFPLVEPQGQPAGGAALADPLPGFRPAPARAVPAAGPVSPLRLRRAGPVRPVRGLPRAFLPAAGAGAVELPAPAAGAAARAHRQLLPGPGVPFRGALLAAVRGPGADRGHHRHPARAALPAHHPGPGRQPRPGGTGQRARPRDRPCAPLSPGALRHPVPRLQPAGRRPGPAAAAFRALGRTLLPNACDRAAGPGYPARPAGQRPPAGAADPLVPLRVRLFHA